MLVDREAEVDALERLLAAAREGLSGVLVLTGEAGIGKTALLEHVAEMADDMRVCSVTGVGSEMDLGFAGLHQLLVPFLGGLEQLPEPQRQALASAFGLGESAPPDRFLVGLAALTLLTEAAAEQPVLCLIDDAQWLDRVSAEVLAFMARRLLADRVGMVFAVREGERAVPFEGLSVLRVDRLPREAASELLAAARPLDHRASEKIIAEAAGNPLALLEFAAEAADGELAGGQIDDQAVAARPLPFGGRLQELYASRVRALPAGAQTLLAVAAADQLGEPEKVWRAAACLGICREVAELPAVQELVSWEPRVRFRNPLIRSAAYYAVTTVARREAHAALAAVSDPELDPDRRAWHAAAAAAVPDEQVAAALERSADRARTRGGWASGAAFLERAAALTPEEDQRARRLLGAAEARLVAGDAPTARALLGQAALHLADPADVARARRLDGLSLYAAGQPSEATTALLAAARMLRPLDPGLARDTLLDAFSAAQFSAQPGAAVAEVAAAVRAAPGLPGAETTVAGLLLGGFAAMAERRYRVAAERLRRAIVPLTSPEPIPDETLPQFPAIATAATALYDDAARHQIEHRWVAELRERGALSALLATLTVQMEVQVEEGRFDDASATLAEGRALSEATGYHAYLPSFMFVELNALAWRGREADARSLADRLLREFARHNGQSGFLSVHKALARLELGLGNYAEALGHALQTLPQEAVPGLGAAAEVVEAGTRSGQQEAALTALEAFTPWALASGTHWALGLLARCRALLADDDHAETEYLLAIAHLRQSRIVPDLARGRLLYGEWLRRQRRRKDARDQLRAAYDTFGRLAMEAFADRARHELRATGEQARKRVVDTAQVLTPQEAQIARLAADGGTNSEIAAKLFLGASTVEYHLRKVFRKLGVTSRVQLSRVLSERAQEPAPQDWSAGVSFATRR
jgi:DNA-binding CsgD family transcriptional regulator